MRHEQAGTRQPAPPSLGPSSPHQRCPGSRTEFDGIEMKILYRDDEGRSDHSVQVAPGSAWCRCMSTPRSNKTYMLEGTLEDAEGRLWRRRLRVAAGRQHPCRARRRTARRSSRCSIARTGFSTGRSLSRLLKNGSRAYAVMPGLVPGIHVLRSCSEKNVDGGQARP